jgi:Leucine-rich repeat (LRR) protein
MDALAASPLAMLDARGSLRLVTDAVHEDDALCLALACRALRDALWARFPARPTGNAHAGKRLRTRDAAVARLGAAVNAAGLLDLSLSGLRALPEGVGRLAYLPHPGLRKLDLHYNRRLAALPVEALGRLGSLEELDIGQCPGLALEHAINTQRGLPALLAYLRGEAVEGVKGLDLSACGLRALPEGMGALTGLKRLNLSYNSQLTALPAGLCALAGLEELNLAGCGLTALPEEIGGLGLAGLKKLDLCNNRGLTALPARLWTLAGLEELYLHDCGLMALPEGIGQLVGLKTLDLSYNGGLTALPEGLWTLAGLEELHLNDCGLRALPEGIGALARLRKLDLGINKELTALPARLGRLRNLEALRLWHCPGLAALDDLHQREGLPALLAHLAAQGEAAAAPGVEPS